MTDPHADLTEEAALGLPSESKRYVRRAMMYVPWRLFVRRQVEFNKSSAAAITSLRRRLRRLERRLDEIAGVLDAVLVSQRESAAIAVREQLYDTEGELRRELSDLQIELARLRHDARLP